VTPQNHKARTYIILHCENQQTAWIHLLKASKEIWDKLKAIYECCNKVLKLLCLKKLVHLTTSDGRIVPKNLEDFQGALDKVAIVGLTFNDQEVILLLATLLNSWRTFVMTRGSVPNLSLTNLIANILQEDYMTKYSPNNNTQTSTFYRRNKFTKKCQLNRPFQTTNCLNMAIFSSEPIPNYPSHRTQL
jgi:hypothetical protein